MIAIDANTLSDGANIRFDGDTHVRYCHFVCSLVFAQPLGSVLNTHFQPIVVRSLKYSLRVVPIFFAVVLHTLFPWSPLFVERHFSAWPLDSELPTPVPVYGVNLWSRKLGAVYQLHPNMCARNLHRMIDCRLLVSAIHNFHFDHLTIGDATHFHAIVSVPTLYHFAHSILPKLLDFYCSYSILLKIDH